MVIKCLMPLFISYCFLVQATAYGQVKNSPSVFPSEGRVLNYRIVGFSFPSVANADNYIIRVATDSCSSDTAFDRQASLSFVGYSNRLVEELPDWGAHYTWRVEARNKTTTLSKSPLYHFATLMVPNVHTNYARLIVTKPAEKYADAYVFIDTGRTLYDMKGNAVWYLPDLDHFRMDTRRVRDIKMTPEGTITFLFAFGTKGRAYEVDYDANVLWRSQGFYDHQLTKLANGHYMVSAGDVENLEWRIFSPRDSGVYLTSYRDTTRKYTTKKYTKGAFGQLLELDEHGKVVWQWREADYWQNRDLRTHIEVDAFSHNDTIDEHQNAFSFDEAHHVIYVSYRNSSVILKVSYPSGEVISVLDGGAVSNKRGDKAGAFCWQHACSGTSDGHVSMLNNNRCHASEPPQVLLIDSKPRPGGGVRTLWSYDCPVTKPKGSEPKGGNVIALPDHSVFVSLCAPYNDLFIVNRDDNRLLWQAQYQRYDAQIGRAIPTTVNYRASLVENRAALEKMIWRSTVR
jgi:Arylsulfotransferase (ASST)